MKQVLIDAAFTGLAFFLGVLILGIVWPKARGYLT